LEALTLFGPIAFEVITILLVSLLGVNGPLFYLDLQLVVLHAYLKKQDLTTYEYIMTKGAQMDKKSTSACEPKPDECGKKYVVEEERTPSEISVFSPQGRHLKRGIRTLPAFFDWFLFRSVKKSRIKAEKYGVTKTAPSEASGALTQT